MKKSYVQAIEERHGKSRFKLWCIDPLGKRFYLGMFRGFERLMVAMAGSSNARGHGSRFEIEVVSYPK